MFEVEAMPDDWRNALSGDDYSTSDVLNRLAPSPYEQVMQQARGLQGGMMEANPIEMAVGLLGPRVPLPRISSPIRAYHGSPHDFDKFDLAKIGTGEGAQSYGHGLYFAEKEGVARSYKDALANDPGHFHVDGVVPPPGEAKIAASWLKTTASPTDLHGEVVPTKATVDAAIDRYARLLRFDPNSAHVGRVRDAMESMVGKTIQPPGPAGRMYEVALHATPEQFLDWDKPLGGQSETVGRAFQDVYGREAAKRDYRVPLNPNNRMEAHVTSLSNAMAGPQDVPGTKWIGSDNAAASAALREAGIPGIKYLDQGSRGAGDGTSNYVVWSPEIIEILRKYGIVGPTVAGGGAALNALGDGQQQ